MNPIIKTSDFVPLLGESCRHWRPERCPRPSEPSSQIVTRLYCGFVDITSACPDIPWPPNQLQEKESLITDIMPDNTFTRKAKLAMEYNKLQYIPSQLGRIISKMSIGETTMMTGLLSNGGGKRIFIFQVEAKERLCAGLYSLYYLPIHHSVLERAWRSLGTSWTHINDTRAVGNTTLLAATDVAVSTLRAVYGYEPSEDFLRAWGRVDTKTALEGFLSVAVEVIESGHEAGSCYRRGAGVYGLGLKLTQLTISPISKTHRPEPLRRLPNSMIRRDLKIAERPEQSPSSKTRQDPDVAELLEQRLILTNEMSKTYRKNSAI